MARILIIDDDFDFRSVMEYRFSDAGYAVEPAASGDQALKK